MDVKLQRQNFEKMYGKRDTWDKKAKKGGESVIDENKIEPGPQKIFGLFIAN